MPLMFMYQCPSPPHRPEGLSSCHYRHHTSSAIGSRHYNNYHLLSRYLAVPTRNLTCYNSKWEQNWPLQPCFIIVLLDNKLQLKDIVFIHKVKPQGHVWILKTHGITSCTVGQSHSMVPDSLLLRTGSSSLKMKYDTFPPTILWCLQWMFLGSVSSIVF